MPNSISIIICTINRPLLLDKCLLSLTRQDYFFGEYEILVVDNQPNFNTKEIVDKYQTSFSDLKYIAEKITGLSIARNRGIQESKFDWICYLDDDAIAHHDFLNRLFYVVEKFQFDAVGGMFFPYHEKEKPRWMSSEYGKLVMPRTTIGILKYGQTVAGGICAFKKSKLIEAGQFPTAIGMRGNVIGYGEEDYVIRQMWKNGCTIGFDPEWKIDHLVAEYKYSLVWQLKRSFAKGRDAQLLIGSFNLLKKIRLIVRIIIILLYLPLKNSFKLLKKGYYFENFILDNFSHALRLSGKISV
jgi:glycosyltransferase involved in cell wall biosynthesis